MKHGRSISDLGIGLTVGVCLGLLILLIPAGLAWLNRGGLPMLEGGILENALAWSRINLKGSAYGFAGALVIYIRALIRLSRLLNHPNPAPERIYHAEQMADIGINLFFGIGVIWTAIGMRGALIQGLSGLTRESAAQFGAFFILRQLVDGGILLALSTTVFGGIGGYALRMAKAVCVGKKMLEWQIRLEQEKNQQLMDKLSAMESRLHEGNECKNLSVSVDENHGEDASKEKAA